MNFLDSVFKQSLAENERNLQFWQDYLNNLNSLDFNVFSDKLKVPILVPIGNKILFRGALKHTNEVTVALGADYFAKCSLKQAEILRQHRIKDARAKVDLYTKEREYLENQLTFNKKNVYEHPGPDIIETCTEDEDRLWREKHRERVRQYNQSEDKKKEKVENEMTDEELWNRLEELELQEELEEEYKSMTNRHDDSDSDGNESFIIKDEESIIFPHISEQIEQSTEENKNDVNGVIKTQSNNTEDTKLSKIDLLKQVLDRQKDLEVKLMELKGNNRGRCQTEQDLIGKLDEMEQLDELEDEMERLDDILQEDSDDTDDLSEEKSTSLKKSVSFADEDDSETLELTFKHSNVEPNTEPYNSDTGITKPSDIYEAYSNLFIDGTTSILRKSKYDNDNTDIPTTENIINVPSEEERHTIVVKDVIEKVECSEKSNNQTRPVSLFKQRRQQKT